jgi:hypothetical protein
MKFRIVASSPRKPGNLIVEEQAGRLRAFVGSTGTISHGLLHADFFQALLRSKNWRRVEDQRWYSIDELRRQFGSPQRVGPALRQQHEML